MTDESKDGDVDSQEREESIETSNEDKSPEDVLKDEIRRFTLNVYDSKVHGQEMVFVALTKAVDRVTELPEPFIKGIVKLSVTASVRRFCQPESYRLVSRLMDALAKHDNVATGRHLAQTVISLFPILPNVSESTARSALPPAKWLLKILANTSGKDLNIVLSACASLSFYCTVCPKASKVFERKLKQALQSISDESLLNAIIELAKEPANVDQTLCLVAYLFTPQVSNVDFSSVFVDLFSRSCLLAKVRPAQSVVERCDTSLSKISADQFKDILLPNIKKALLRSPEVAMYGVRRTFNSASFPLDAYADEIVKAASGSLTSSDDELRNATVSVLVALANASQPAGTGKIIAKLFDQISSAKSAEQRVSFYEGIAACAATKAANSIDLDKVANDVIAKAGKADKDTHEGTVSSQWDSAVAWANRLTQVTPALVSMFKEASKLPVVVRSSGYRALAKVITARAMTSVPDGTETILWAELESAQKEALDAIGLTTVLLKTTPQGSEKQKKAWEKISNNEQLFKDKSLSVMKWKDAVLWAELVERVVLDRPFSDGPQTYPSMALKSLSLLLFWPHWEVRRRAALAVERILTIEGASFSVILADFLYAETVNGNIEQALRKVPQSTSAADWVVPGEWFVLALRQLLTPKVGDLEKLAIHTLLLASLPRLVEVDGSVWLRWMHGQATTTWEANGTFCNTAISRVLNCQQRDVRDTALITLVALNMASVKAALWTHVEHRLSEIDSKTYCKVTEKEVAIWKCPDGVLFNTSALEFDEGEIKGDTKGLSHKEQKQEMQLRRELAEQKKKAGLLTAKQKQVLEKELSSEKAIRDEIEALYVDAESRLDEARAIVTADHHGAFARPSLLFDVCLPLTRSALVTREAANLFLAYRSGAFEHTDDYLDELIASCWLRTIGSRWHDPNWADEPLPDALKRAFALLNERAFVIDTGEDEDDALLFDEIVGAPQLTLMYPMIKTVLNGTFEDFIKENALTLLQNAIHKRFLKDGAVLQLPMLEFATLLLSHYCETSSAPCLQALVQLVGLANDTENVGDRVVSMVGGALSYLTNASSSIRADVIQVLSAPQLLTRLVASSTDESFVINCLVRLYVVRFDDVESICESATRLWYASIFHLRTSMGDSLIDECVSDVGFLRESASKATAAFAEEFPGEKKALLTKIDEVYRGLYDIRGAVFDNVGRMMHDAIDEWERRTGVGLVLNRLSLLVDAEEAEQLIRIVVPRGLEDRNATCRESLCAAAVEAIRRQGPALMPTVLPFLENLSDKTPVGAQHDNLRQGLVVLLGSLAQFLEPSSAKVKAIVARLLEVLNTPSQSVQESVSRCLTPLVPSVRDDAKRIVTRLKVLLFTADTYGERRGAAYGLGGIVKGLGMTSLKEFELLEDIRTNIIDKKDPKKREGALLGLEIFSSTLGKLFEPYMIQILPTLLLSFGDADNNVRRAADDTARAMMSSMSAHGTKLVLPSLTTALDDDSWRTKCAATELLGHMAFCASRQLSACLPSVVPKLIEALAVAHPKVISSAEKALRQIARVVRNPEILGVTNQLMIGLLDPANKTNVALQAVLNTKFIHYIDAPSLALIMPIVRRAFEDRNSETRRVAAQIIANIYNLTENKDMEPYLANLVPGLQKSLLDPVPEIRTVSARALGSIVSKSTGATSEHLRNTIIPWLKEKLVSPQSNVDRSGAAQGLCEVLSGVGNEQLDYVMPEIISTTESTDVSPETRDGYILMYIYLPMVFGERFVPYLPRVVPPILKALADENEYVRASALKAGQRLIAQYCSHARRLLLPQLESALIDENWRIRYAAVQLIGDFLFTVSGVTGKSTSSTANEDDTMGMEQAGKTIVRALGQQCRDRVIAGLYLARSDVAMVVRQAAGHVWKIVVSNTPRTLKEVMKTLFEMVVDSLASPHEERQQMGARCLGELVRKMGDKIINEILPILEHNQTSDEAAKRVGVAVALHEIIDNMSKDVLNHYLSSLVGPVRNAICDDEASVRLAAADTFSVLYRHVGHEALDEIITPLLEKLTPEQDHILEGLCQVMKQNSKQMLPYLLPRLTKPPVNVHALCSLAAVAGDSLSRQLPRVLDALLASCVNNDQYDPMIDPCEKVVIAVADEDGIPVLSEYLLQRAAKGNVPSAVLLHTFIDKAGAPLSELAEDLLPGLLNLYASEHPQIIDHSVLAAIGVASSLDTREMQEILPLVKKTLNIIVAQAKGKPIPGFAHEKSLQPLLPMLRESILQGGVELKALAGETLGMVVSLSEPVALKAHVVGITGPLIRVLGDRYPANVKLAILDTLSKLLDKVDTLLRPFLPQLQSTFVKALQEPSSRPVRLAAGGALARLLRIHPKPEPLVLELFKVLANTQDDALMETTFVAARSLVTGCAAKLTPTTIAEGYRVCELIYSTPIETPSDIDTSLTVCSGALLGELAVRTNDFAAQKIFADVESSTKLRTRQAKAFALQQMCHSNAADVWSEQNAACKSALTSAFTADPVTACAAIRAAANILISDAGVPDRDLLSSLARAINHQSTDVRRVTAAALGHVFDKAPSALPNDVLKLVIPQLVNGAKESNSAVRSNSELALVYAFHSREGQEKYDSYRSSVEGVAQKVLDEVQVSLRRVIKHGDFALEPLYNLLSV